MTHLAKPAEFWAWLAEQFAEDERRTGDDPTRRSLIEVRRRLLWLHCPSKLDDWNRDYYRKIPSLNGRNTDDILVCEYEQSLCHSSEGLRCELPEGDWPCEDIRVVGLFYAARAGYRDEWRPRYPALTNDWRPGAIA